MKKIITAIVMALLLVPALALADVRMPARRGVVTDDADVLSAQTAADIASYAEKVEDETGLRLQTAIVHFLDGMDVQTYAQRLFERWELKDEDLLLLVAAGEDSFAAAMGSRAADRLGKFNAENLMYTSSGFSALIRSQQYDAAFADYCTAFNDLLQKQLGETVRMGSLFGAVPEAPSVHSFGSELWDEVMIAIDEVGQDYQRHAQQREDKDNGITAGGWIVLIVLAWLVLGRKTRRKWRAGCGCSPLGWLIGLLGLGFLFKRD